MKILTELGVCVGGVLLKTHQDNSFIIFGPWPPLCQYLPLAGNSPTWMTKALHSLIWYCLGFFYIHIDHMWAGKTLKNFIMDINQNLQVFSRVWLKRNFTACMALIKHSFGFTLISEILSDVLQLWNWLQIYLCLMCWKELKWPSQNNGILIFALCLECLVKGNELITPPAHKRKQTGNTYSRHITKP